MKVPRSRPSMPLIYKEERKDPDRGERTHTPDHRKLRKADSYKL